MSLVTTEAVPRRNAALLNDIPQAQEDLMFGLSAAFRADSNPRKVDLGVGTYRDAQGLPYIFSAVKKARKIIENDASLNHEYLPIHGLQAFLDASQRLLFGHENMMSSKGRIASLQQISGSGSLHLAAAFLARWYPQGPAKKVYVSSPAYANHLPILHHVGLETGSYPYYEPTTNGLDFIGMLETIRALPHGSIILLHACCHNPTGVDLTKQQWRDLATVMRSRNHLPFFDSAYQGFATGDVEEDAWAVRHFLQLDFPTMFVAQSYAKSFGLYGERVGCLHVITSESGLAERILRQMKKLQRVEISTPPAYGARIVSTILDDEQLREEWEGELATMADRIKDMRVQLRGRLEKGGSTASWKHITDQKGMFCFSGLSEYSMQRLRDEWHVYATPDGRLSMSGLNESNLDYVATAIHAVTAKVRL